MIPGLFTCTGILPGQVGGRKAGLMQMLTLRLLCAELSRVGRAMMAMEIHSP